MQRRFRVTVMGGGTGSFTMLTGLKNYPDLDLTAIVAMTDDGGSTGVLRDEMGALPPGDSRQCLVALSESENIWRELFNHRFSKGSLEGQSFGNLFISALEQITNSFEKALELAGEILKARGRIIPVTLDDVKLTAKTTGGEYIFGEHKIDLKTKPIKSLHFKPEPSPNPEAIRKILQSDLIVIGPGDVYTSILPNLMVKGIADALRHSKAKKVYVCNIMTQKNHTHNFKVIDFVNIFEKYLGKDVFDYVTYNTREPHEDFSKSYAQEEEYPVKYDINNFSGKKIQFVGRDLLSEKIPKVKKGDKLKRALVRHDPFKVSSLIYDILNNNL